MKENYKSPVCYSDFGAVGDGVANDFEAMMLAHEYANEHNLPVLGENGKTYRIASTEKDGVARSIIIKTSTDWQGATIIIDDSEIEHKDDKHRDFNSPIFKVLPQGEGMFELDEEIVAKIGSLPIDAKKLDLGLGYPVLAVVYNNEVRHYIRFGPNANTGSPQHEILVVDKDGNIDPSTPLMYAYDKLTKIKAVRIDLEELVIQNANVIQIASHIDTVKTLPDGTTVNKKQVYFHRNMTISRSNTVIRNVNHYIKNEITPEEQAQGMFGPAYKGLLTPSFANNVTLENCVVSARRYFTPGTYGFSADHTNNIVLKNCKQDNFYNRDENGNLTKVISMETHPLTGKPLRWGLGGTNFCKNMVYDGCEITRFDAHQGLCNGKIINSRVAMINLIGCGDFLVENSVIELKDSTVFNLRRDYGATWNGKVTIRNCTVDPNEEVKQKSGLWIVYYSYANHNFGYTCHIPDIEIDNLKVTKPHLTPIHFFESRKSGEVYENPITEHNLHLPILSNGKVNNNPTVPPSSIKVINNEQNLKYYIYDVPFFANTALDGVERVPAPETEPNA